MPNPLLAQLASLEEIFQCRDSFRQFVKGSWHVIEPNTPFVDGWHIDAICEHLEALQKGQIKKLLIAMPPRHCKCVKIGSMILLANGYYKPIEEIQIGDILLSSDGIHVTKDKVVWKVASGKKRLIKITLNDGRTITTTAEHRLYGWNEWVEAGTLQVGDPLCVIDRTPDHDYRPYAGKQEVTSQDAFLLALWLSEGTKGPEAGFQFTSASQAIRREAREIARRRGWGYTWIHYTEENSRYRMRLTNKSKRIDNAPVQFLKDHGVRYCTTKTVHVPESIFKASNRVVARFIGTYIACDGYVATQAKSVGITTISERMALDLQLLLTRFEIHSTVQLYYADYQGKKFPAWRLLISGADNFRKMAQHIIIPDKQEKVEQLVATSSEKTAVRDVPSVWRKDLKHSPSWFRFYGGGLRIDKPGWTDKRKVLQAAAIDGDKNLEEKMTGGLGWRKIVAIEDAGVEETYDLETEKYHAFFAEGVLSHNSTLVSVCYPAWVWLLDPAARFLCASYALSLSLRDSTRCRALIDSDWYQSKWSDVYQWAGDQNLKARFETTAKGVRIATSVEGAATGEGGSHLILDDCHNIQEAESDMVRQAALDWFDRVFVSRLNDQKTGKIVVIGQRVHEQDIIGHLKETGDWEYLMLPAEYIPEKRTKTSIGWKDPRKREGEVLWKEKFPKEVLKYLKKTLGIHYFSQYQQTPVRDQGNIFKSQYFLSYSDTDEYYVLHTPNGDEQIAKQHCRTILSTDLAVGLKAENDYTVILVWAVTPDMKFILIDIVHDRMESPDGEELIWNRAVSAKRLWGVIVEDAGQQKGTIQRLRRGTPVIGKGFRKGVPVIPYAPKGDKISRAQNMVVWMRSGNFYFNPNMSKYTDLKKELISFPRTDHDDYVDGVTITQVLFEFGEPSMMNVDEEAMIANELAAIREIEKVDPGLADFLLEDMDIEPQHWWEFA